MKMALVIDEAAAVLSSRIFKGALEFATQYKKEYEKNEKSDFEEYWGIVFEFQCVFYYIAVDMADRILNHEIWTNFIEFLRNNIAKHTAETVLSDREQEEKNKLEKSLLDNLDGAISYYGKRENEWLKDMKSLEGNALYELGKRIAEIVGNPKDSFYIGLGFGLGNDILASLGINELLKSIKVK
jgi:hypothetical protein